MMSWECGTCGLTFSTQAAMIEHLREEGTACHEESKRYAEKLREVAPLLKPACSCPCHSNPDHMHIVACCDQDAGIKGGK